MSGHPSRAASAVRPKTYGDDVGKTRNVQMKDFYSKWVEDNFFELNAKKQPVPASTYGQLVFEGGNQAAPPVGKPFIRLQKDTPAEKICQLMQSTWDLALPRFILSVTGGATSFELPPRLDRMIRQGLRKAAQGSNAWIITGGTNTGVMKYVGDTLASDSTSVTGPCIGFLPWSIVNGKAKLEFHPVTGEKLCGDVAIYPDPDSFEKQPYKSLDRNHTHFILVDDGRGPNDFGGEIELRASVEAYLQKLSTMGQFGIESHISGVVLAIQGGPGTLDQCYNAAVHGVPVIVCDGSGRAADIIAYANTLYDNVPNDSFTEEGLRAMIHDHLSTDPAKIDKFMTQVTECVKTGNVFTYSVDFFGRHDVPLDVKILDTVLEFERRSLPSQTVARASTLSKAKQDELAMCRVLELALTWSRIDIASQETARRRVLVQFQKKISNPADTLTRAKARMLKWALSKNQQEFSKLFLETMDVKDIDAFLKHKTNQEVAIIPTRALRKKNKAKLGTRRRRPQTRLPVSFLQTSDDGSELNRFSVPLPSCVFSGPFPTHLPPLIERLNDLKEDFDYDVECDPQNASWMALTDFVEFFLRFTLSLGYMVSVCKREDAPTSYDTVDAFAEALHHLWAHRQLDNGWHYAGYDDPMQMRDTRLCAFVDLPEELQDSMRQRVQMFVDHLHEHDVRIWQPDTLEDLFILRTIVGRTKSGVNHLRAVFPHGEFTRCNLHLLVCKATGGQCSLEAFNNCNPYLHLMLWAALCNFQTQALHFWSRSPGQAIPNALLVCLVVKHTLKQTKDAPAQVVYAMKETVEIFMEKAVDLLREVEKRDVEIAVKLLLAKSPNTANVPAWKMAYHLHAGAFSALESMLQVAKLLWNGRVDLKNSRIKLFFAAFLFPYVLIPGEQIPVHKQSQLTAWETFKYSIPVRMDVDEEDDFDDIDEDDVGDSDDEDQFDALLDATEEEQAAAATGARQLVPRGASIPLQRLGLTSTLNGAPLPPSRPESARDDDSPISDFFKVTILRYYHFYNSPVVSFILEAAFFFCFLLLFSWSAVTLETLSLGQALTTQPLFVVVFAWMATIVVQELVQLVDLGQRYWNLWNTFDVIIVLFYISSLMMKLGNDAWIQRSRAMYATVAILLWMRFARSYAVHPMVGPKLVMIQLMLEDIKVFVQLVALVYAGYAVALFSVLHEEAWNNTSIHQMLFMPYFQIYGELFLEEMREFTECTELEFSNCANNDIGWFAAVLLAIYLMVANILLVNLLIAMMSKTYEDVQDTAEEHWALMALDALLEYDSTWFLPAPFNIIYHLSRPFTWLYRRSKCCHCGRIEPMRLDAEESKLRPEVEEKVVDYVEEALANSDESAADDLLQQVERTNTEMQTAFAITIKHLETIQQTMAESSQA
eukprot:m.21225 g.21225  ORF g.21225 m.21225 type:complete len:1390 (-) comp8262_c0_seq1:191-4360(-)